MDGVFGVEPGCDGSAEGFDGSNCGLGGTGDDDVDGDCEGGGATGEEFDAVFYAMDSARSGEFAEGDGFGWIDAALGDPVRDAREVYGGHVDGMTVCILSVGVFSDALRQHVHILEAFFSTNDFIWRLSGGLPSSESSWDCAFLSLPFVTTARGFAFAGRWSSTTADLLVV